MSKQEINYMNEEELLEFLIMTFKELGFNAISTAGFTQFIRTSAEMIEMLEFLSEVHPTTDTQVSKKIIQMMKKYHPEEIRTL